MQIQMEPISRERLQNHKRAMIKKRANIVVNQHISHILQAAELDKSSYFVSTNVELKIGHMCGAQLPEPTIDDIVNAFKEQFPDCSVEYIETWVDQPSSRNQQIKVLKKGILIDWS